MKGISITQRIQKTRRKPGGRPPAAAPGEAADAQAMRERPGTVKFLRPNARATLCQDQPPGYSRPPPGTAGSSFMCGKSPGESVDRRGRPGRESVQRSFPPRQGISVDTAGHGFRARLTFGSHFSFQRPESEIDTCRLLSGRPGGEPGSGHLPSRRSMHHPSFSRINFPGAACGERRSERIS